MENIELTDWETIILSSLVEENLERKQNLLKSFLADGGSLVNSYQTDIEELEEINRKLGY